MTKKQIKIKFPKELTVCINPFSTPFLVQFFAESFSPPFFPQQTESSDSQPITLSSHFIHFNFINQGEIFAHSPLHILQISI
jgi:hypothetical protein